MTGDPRPVDDVSAPEAVSDRIAQSFFVLLLVGLISVGVALPLVGGTILAGFTTYLGRDATFTGRTGCFRSPLML